jgi:hypothetical protein
VFSTHGGRAISCDRIHRTRRVWQRLALDEEARTGPLAIDGE